MSDNSSTRQSLLAGLILAATLAFGLGIVLERSITGEVHTETSMEQATAARSSESGEGSSGETPTQRNVESGEGSIGTPPAATHTEAGEQRILGINPESNGPILGAIAVSLALAAGAWRSRAGALMFGIVIFGVLFAAFDLRDVIYQAQQSRVGLATLAAIVTLLHLATSAVAAIKLRAKSAPLRA